jgi:hypothetical protein
MIIVGVLAFRQTLVTRTTLSNVCAQRTGRIIVGAVMLGVVCGTVRTVRRAAKTWIDGSTHHTMFVPIGCAIAYA